MLIHKSYHGTEFAICSACILIFLIGGCNNNGSELKRNISVDDVPPVFYDLTFPANNSTIPEGRLIISGTLVDESYDEDEPVCLEVDVLTAFDGVKTFRLPRNSISGDSPNHWFDPQTGEFEYNFNSVPLRPYTFDIRLTGKDGAGNVSTLQARVNATEISGIDNGAIYSARQNYAISRSTFLSQFVDLLSYSGGEYDYDIAVMEHMIDHFNYINMHPEIDAWADNINNLVDSIQGLPYENTTIKALVDSSVEGYNDYYRDIYKMASIPWYRPGTTYEQIVEQRNEELDMRSNPTISATPLASAPPNRSVQFVVYGRKDLRGSQPEILADFTVTAHPELPISITGTVGASSNQVTISPADYDPPIKFFKLFYDTGLALDILVQF